MGNMPSAVIAGGLDRLPLVAVIVVLLFAGGLVEYLFLRKFYRYETRSQALAQVAQQLGFSFSPSVSFTADGLHHLEHCLGGQCKSILTGKLGGLQVKVFDYEYFVECAESMHALQHTVAAFRVSAVALPEVCIHPAAGLEKIGLLQGARVGTYVVACEGEPPRAPIRAKIAELPGKWWIEHVHDWLFVYRPNTLIPPEEFPRFLAEVDEIVEKLLSADSVRNAS